MSCQEIIFDLMFLTQKMMKQNGCKEFNFKFEPLMTRGDNYAGEVIFYTASCKYTEKNYSLVFKTCKRTKKIKKSIDNILYNKEIHMYQKVLPCLQSFGKEVCSSFELDCVPKAYWFFAEANRDSLILENLNSSGYRICDRTKPMNLDHVLLVLETFGKFHAASLALKIQRPNKFQQIITEAIDTYSPGEVKSIRKLFECEFVNALGVLKELGRNNLARKYQEVVNDFKRHFKTETAECDKMVITHGDCWNDNIMFKYDDDESSKPLKVCFIDFQLSGYDTPVKDLSYFIYTSCDQPSLEQLDFLLKTYYDSLSSTLKSLGCRPEELFTMDQLNEHWKKYSLFGLITSTLAIKRELCSFNEIPETDSLGNDTSFFADIFSALIEDKDEYNRRILDVFTHYAETCL